MDYPVWQVPFLNLGLVIGLISVVHVFVSHFAVGGGLYLVLAEGKALRDGSAEIMRFTKEHTRFFLLLTTVFGALTGVGIWFAITVSSPAATSLLVSSFVFVLATEWTFFLAEIVSLFVYYYTFGRMGSVAHRFIGWLYFAFAWLSLAAINGVVTFMFTPGDWQGTGDVLAGFLNPTFWPSLALRTCLALTMAGLFGLFRVSTIRDEAARTSMARWSAKWILLPFTVLLASAWWYFTALPPAQKAMVLRKTQDIAPFLRLFLAVLPALLLGGLLFVRQLPRMLCRPLGVVLLVLGLAQMAGFEWVREAGRRPFVIQGRLYSNSIPAQALDGINSHGVLATARWTLNKAVTPENSLDAGREIYLLECKSCHGSHGPMLDLGPRTNGLPEAGIEAGLAGQGKVAPYMPPFAGTAAERKALAGYLLHLNNTTTPRPE